MKILNSFITIIVLVGIITTTSFAVDDTNYLDGENYYDYLFYATGVTNAKLHDIENELNVDLYEYFGVDIPSASVFQEFLNSSETSTVPNGNARSTTAIDVSYNMPATQWNALLSVVEPSDILVTKDCVTLAIDHGHAALACEDGMTVELFGPQSGGLPGATGESVYINMSTVWRHCKSCRLYEVPDAAENDIKEDIAQYAINNLTGWEYEFTANINSTDKVNCATLVWKAYENAGITLGHFWDFTVIPSDYVEQNNLYMVFSTGWGHINPYVWA